MINVIPSPRRLTLTSGEFHWRAGTRVAAHESALSPVIERFCRDVTRRTGVWTQAASPGAERDESTPVRVVLGSDAELDDLPCAIGVSPGRDFNPDERYTLFIQPHAISVRAAEPVGVARALTTLLQIVATAPMDVEGVILLPCLRIADTPQFAWRGLTFDVVRRHYTTTEIMRVIDLIALYKLNVLHLHLTDDEGWRIQAGRPPKERASDGTFYSNAELRELLRYAADRFVTIVPEIDAPGHTRALLQLRRVLKTDRNTLSFDDGLPAAQRGAWLDPDLPATFMVLESILGEIAEIFPGEFLHIGGNDPLGMPEEAYVRFVRRMRELALALGKRTVGYQETARALDCGGHVIQYHRKSASDLERASECEMPILLSPQSHAYLDVPYAEPSADPDQEMARQRLGLRTFSQRTVADSFDWQPSTLLPPSAAKRAFLAGVSAAIWCDTVKSFQDLAFLLLPRLPGTAEKAWSYPGSGWVDHCSALASHGQLWEQDQLSYFKSSRVPWSTVPSYRGEPISAA